MHLAGWMVALQLSICGVEMVPSIPPPQELVGRSIDCKLKLGWHYDVKRGTFIGPKGDAFAPASLPKGARIVYKVPSLAAPRRPLSAAEADLSRYMQVILPNSRSVEKLLLDVRSWPAIEDAHITPEISLP